MKDKNIESLTNQLDTIKNFFWFKSIYRNKPIQFAEDLLGVKLRPYQKILLNNLHLKRDNSLFHVKTKPTYLSLSTKSKLIESIRQAINGNNVLFVNKKRNNYKNEIDFVKSFIDDNNAVNGMFIDNDITYVINDNAILFNTGGSIEFDKEYYYKRR